MINGSPEWKVHYSWGTSFIEEESGQTEEVGEKVFAKFAVGDVIWVPSDQPKGAKFRVLRVTDL